MIDFNLLQKQIECFDISWRSARDLAKEKGKGLDHAIQCHRVAAQVKKDKLAFQRAVWDEATTEEKNKIIELGLY